MQYVKLDRERINEIDSMLLAEERVTTGLNSATAFYGVQTDPDTGEEYYPVTDRVRPLLRDGETPIDKAFRELTDEDIHPSHPVSPEEGGDGGKK